MSLLHAHFDTYSALNENKTHISKWSDLATSMTASSSDFG